MITSHRNTVNKNRRTMINSHGNKEQNVMAHCQSRLARTNANPAIQGRTMTACKNHNKYFLPVLRKFSLERN